MNKIINVQAAKRIAVVADNNKRTELVEWSYFNRDMLVQHQLIAIGETGEILEGTLNRPVRKLFSRQTGGYQQLIEMVQKNKIDLLFFFASPSIEKEEDEDLKKVLVVASKYNVMLACNQQTTNLIMASEFQKNDKIAPLKSHPGFFKETISFISQVAHKLSAAI